MNSADPDPPHNESPYLDALRTLSHITTAVAVMLITGGIGYFIDQWLGITFFSLIASGCGIYLAIQYLIRKTSDK